MSVVLIVLFLIMSALILTLLYSLLESKKLNDVKDGHIEYLESVVDHCIENTKLDLDHLHKLGRGVFVHRHTGQLVVAKDFEYMGEF